jgi:hypothetical protein
MLSAACISIAAAQSASAVTINEFRVDHVGADTNEYFELFGTPGESLNGLTYIVIGDSPGGGGSSETSGAIEVAISLDGFQIGADGFFLAVESIYVGPAAATAELVIDLNFENSDNMTQLLVSGFTGLDGDLIDSDRDGLLDAVMPWASIIDGLALEETQNSVEFNYGPQLGVPVMGAAVSGENIQHVYRSIDGAGEWLPGNVELGAKHETPGRSNVLPVWGNADINGDGFVGIADLNEVLGYWNQGTPPATGTPSIPEPASLALLGMGAAALNRRR